MKRLFVLFISALFPCFVLLAQDASVWKTAEQYQKMRTLTATVTRTCHNAAVIGADAADKGKFYLKKPGKMCLTFSEGTDMLLMDEGTYSMVKGGKVSVAKGKMIELFKVLQLALDNLFRNGGDTSELSELASVEVSEQGNTRILSVTPSLSDTKAKRRMMFTSFVFTLDAKTLELKSMRMNEKAGNYTQYDFSDYVIDGTVSDTVFIPQSL